MSGAKIDWEETLLAVMVVIWRGGKRGARGESLYVMRSNVTFTSKSRMKRHTLQIMDVHSSQIGERDNCFDTHFMSERHVNHRFNYICKNYFQKLFSAALFLQPAGVMPIVEPM